MLQIKNRGTFYYIEKSKINVSSGIWHVNNKEFPIADYVCIEIGPGVEITHKAIKMASDFKVGLLFVSSDGSKMYSICENFFIRSTNNFLNQVSKYSDEKHKLKISNKLMSYRFPDWENQISIENIRIKEASLMKKYYHDLSKKYNVEWKGREINFSKSDWINKLITQSNIMIYGLVDIILNIMGYNSYLGYIHKGRGKSLVYDIADIIKYKYTIPFCFEIISNNVVDNFREKCYNMLKLKNIKNIIVDIIDEEISCDSCKN